MLVQAIFVLALSAIVSSELPLGCVHCICEVETGCKVPDPLCDHTRYGKEGTCGPYQITEAYFRQVLSLDKDGAAFKEDFTTCMQSLDCSTRVVELYLNNYLSGLEAGLGREAHCVDIARLHLGGPGGYRYDYTYDYGWKVQHCVNLFGSKD